MHEAFQRSAFRFSRGGIQTFVVRNHFRKLKRFGKMHGEIDFATGSPAFQTSSANDRVVAHDLQVGPHNRRIRVRVNQVQNEMAALALWKRVSMDSGMLRWTQYRAYVVVAKNHGVL